MTQVLPIHEIDSSEFGMETGDGQGPLQAHVSRHTSHTQSGVCFMS